MDYKDREILAAEGIKLLSEGVFPNKILEILKDVRSRKDVSDRIFYPKNSPKPNELNEKQKAERAKRLKVELGFIAMMGSLDSFRKIPYIFLLIGLTLIFFTTIRNNGNLPFGILTIIEALILFIVSFKNENIIKYVNHIAFGGLILFCLELLIFQLPNPVLQNLDQDILANRREALSKTFSLASPFIYLILKTSIFGMFFYFRHQILNFFYLKYNFENHSSH